MEKWVSKREKEVNGKYSLVLIFGELRFTSTTSSENALIILQGLLVIPGDLMITCFETSDVIQQNKNIIV